MIWLFVLTSSLWLFWTDDSAVNMYILHSGNSLIWIQVIVNALYLVNVKLTSVFHCRPWGIFRNRSRNTYLYSLLLSLQPLFPGLNPYLDEGCQHPPLRTVVDTCAAQLLYECQSELLSYFTELIQIRCTVAWPRVLTGFFCCCYRMSIISHRETLCLCSLNRCSYLPLQPTLQKLPLLLAKVQILKILETAFLCLLSMAVLSVEGLTTAE